ncbi:MAG: A/G-specific adenine glycosylase, partial [Acidimicrobiales bacterium]
CCTARAPRCGACPLARRCKWARAGAQDPDPGTAGCRRQGEFSGSDRQGRGRLVSALRLGPVAAPALAAAAGWPDDTERASRVAHALVDEGMACWLGGALTLV